MNEVSTTHVTMTIDIDLGGHERHICALDPAYDKLAIHEPAEQQAAQACVPPAMTPAWSCQRPRSSARDRTIKRVMDFGRWPWKKECGHRRGFRPWVPHAGNTW